MFRAERLPIGQAGLLNQSAEKIPAVLVDNEVIWVNPDIKTPLFLKQGKPTNIALLLTPEQDSSIENTGLVRMFVKIFKEDKFLKLFPA